MIYPKRLPPNGTIAVTSPATTPDPNILNRGVIYLESLGYRVIVGDTCTLKEEYLAGPDLIRAQELVDFFADTKVDAIFCTRGGYGGMHLLPLIDYSVINKNPKLLCGFSDITALQWAMYTKCGLVTVSGAMVATDFGQDQINRDMESQFWDLIETGHTEIRLNHSQISTQVIEGPLIAGTLAVAAKQMGSPYFPDITDHIVLFEDVDEPIHKIEGYLRQFQLAGQFDHVKALIFGIFSPIENESYDEVPTLDKIFQRVLSPASIPFATGLNYGHVKNKISLPVGTTFCLSLGPITYLRSTGSLYSH
jgi:muramoyltetrapeptide carboxypeptidase